MHVHDLLGELPVNGIHLRLRLEIEQAKVKRLLRFFLDLLDVVQTFEAIAALEPLLHIENVADQLVIFLRHLDLEFRRGFLDGAERFHDQDRMMRHNRAPAFAHDRRMRDAFGIADVHDVPDDVVRVFLEGIIRGAVEIAARSVVIDPEAAADIQVTELMPELAQLCVIARRFAHGAFDRGNVRHLRADVEMNELEAMRESRRFQHLARGHEAGGIETKLRVLAAAGRPFARALAVQAHANADVRLDADFLRSADRLLEFLELLDHDDNGLAELAAEQSDADESAVLVAVADDEALGVLVHRERGDQFRFAAGFESEMKFLAGFDDLFDHFPQLVDLDRKNSAVMVLVTEFRHRVLKRAVDRLDAVTQQVLKPDDEREPEAAIARLVYDFENIDRAAFFLKGAHLDIAGAVDREVAGAPAIDVVSGNGGFNVPLVLHFFGCGRSRRAHIQSPLRTCKHASRKSRDRRHSCS